MVSVKKKGKAGSGSWDWGEGSAVLNRKADKASVIS